MTGVPVSDEMRAELDKIEAGTPDLERQLRAAQVSVDDGEAKQRAAGAAARQIHHAGQTRLTVTSHHGRREAAAAALRRIAGFFRAPTQSAEQLTAEDRWPRILAEALKKYLHGR